MMDIEKAAQILKNGGIVIFPTDTVYGIGCLADNKESVDRLHEIKGTPKNQKFPLLVSSVGLAYQIAIISKAAQELITKYWPGALTIVLKSKDKKTTVALRMPDSQMVLDLIKLTGSPIIGTSANIHGAKTPTSFEELDSKIIMKADFVLIGQCKKKVESTIVDLTGEELKLVREGAIKL